MEGIKSRRKRKREESESEIESKIEMEEEFCAVVQRIKSEDVKPFYTTFPVDYTVQRLDNSSELCTGIAQLTKDLHPSLYCRLCATPDKDMADIFSYDATGKNILQMINYCLPVTVKETDTLPRRICSFCSEELERCYRFHETVVKAEEQLLALGKVASIKLEKTEINDEYFKLYNTQRGLTECINIDESFQKTSDVEMCTKESPTITEEAQTTVNRDVLLPSLRPCAVVLSIIKTRHKNNSDVENGSKSSDDSKLQNPDPITGAFDSQTTTASEVIRESTCDSEGTSANNSGSISDEENILTLRSGKKVDHKADLATREQGDTSNQDYQCTLCARVFTNQSNLNQHNKLHTNKGLYVCESCGKKFTSRIARDRHHVIHTKERPFECTICKMTFGSLRLLQQHATVHTDKRNYPCSMCDQSFKTHGTRKKHMLVHSNQRPWECDYCKRNFKRKEILQCHITAKHTLHTGEGFACEYCEKKFDSKYQLKCHHYTHKPPMECPVCQKTFTNSSKLKRHADVHFKPESYSCSVCNESFKTLGRRNRHMTFHTDKSRSECEHCKKNFKTKKDLQRHMAEERKLDISGVHAAVYVAEKPWECDYCKLRLKTKDTLRNHLKHCKKRPVSDNF